MAAMGAEQVNAWDRASPGLMQDLRWLSCLSDLQVFDFEKWSRHRSPSKYLEQVLSIPRSHTLRRCTLPVVWVFFVSLCMCTSHWLVEAGAIPKWMRLPYLECAFSAWLLSQQRDLLDYACPSVVEVGILASSRKCTGADQQSGPSLFQAGRAWFFAVEMPLTITSFALSLLLVFRTNSSYGRFAEARQIWGMVLNRSRDLVRMAIAFFPVSDWDGKATFSRWTIAYSKCLLCHLRPGSSLREEVSQTLCREEMQVLLAVNHPTVTCIQVRSALMLHICDSLRECF